MPTAEQYLAQYARTLDAFQAAPVTPAGTWPVAQNGSILGEYSELLVAAALTYSPQSHGATWDRANACRTGQLVGTSAWVTTRAAAGYSKASYSDVDLWLCAPVVAGAAWATSVPLSRGVSALLSAIGAGTGRPVLTSQVKARRYEVLDRYDAVPYWYFVDPAADGQVTRDDLLNAPASFPWRPSTVDLFTCVEWTVPSGSPVAVPRVRVLARDDVRDAIVAREAAIAARHSPSSGSRPLVWSTRKLDFVDVFTGQLGTDLTPVLGRVPPLTLA
jgi:hypothetical protein